MSVLLQTIHYNDEHFAVFIVNEKGQYDEQVAHWMTDDDIKELRDQRDKMKDCSFQTGISLCGDGRTITTSSYPDLKGERVFEFLKVYADKLHRNFSDKPEIYKGDLNKTLTRMRQAIIRETFNKDSDSFKQTCKDFKIKHTYKSIRAFLKGE